MFGYVPQAQLGLFPFTVAETVLMGRTAHIGPFATPSRGDRAVAEEMLAVLGIGHLAARPYTEISGGERQLTPDRARALARQPPSLVMDGPPRASTSATRCVLGGGSGSSPAAASR